MSRLIHNHCQLKIKESAKAKKFPLPDEIMARGCQIECLPSLCLPMGALKLGEADLFAQVGYVCLSWGMETSHS